jgi:HK97 family phage major capsid protein
MATIDDIIAGIEVELEAAKKRRDKTIHQVKTILAQAAQEGRANLTQEEDATTAQLFAERDQAKADIRGIQTKLENAERVKTEERAADDAAREVKPTPAAAKAASKPSYDRVARVGREERTYRPDTDKRGTQFLWDVVRQFLFNDVQAGTRLSQHMAEERVERAEYLTRAVGTGAFTGLVVPQYLTDMYAPATAALRPFADICNKHDLPPDGMTVNISRITTSTGVALQTAENTAVQETNADDTLLTENIQTAAGQQTVSRQAIERGTGVDDVLMNDLFRRYATALDANLINQATTGLEAVSVDVAYTATAPTAAGLYPKILGAIAGAEAALLAQAIPSHAVMHSRRWHWMSSQLVSTWPFINQPGIVPQGQTGGANYGAGYNKGIRGVLPNGTLVVVDNNIVTNAGTGSNEDAIYVVADAECHLWEDPNAPVFIRAEQAAAATLGILMVLYGYYAYSFRRYSSAFQSVSGTGLVTPAF